MRISQIFTATHVLPEDTPKNNEGKSVNIYVLLKQVFSRWKAYEVPVHVTNTETTQTLPFRTPGCPTDGVANEVLQEEYLQRLAALCHQGSPGWQECTHCAANWFRKEPLFSVPLHNYREDDHSPAPHCQPDNGPDESSRGYRAESHLPWHITE